MASLLKRPLVAGSLVVVLLVAVTCTRRLFFTSGDLHYVFVQTWGSEGTGPGEFRDPIGVAIGPSGDIYVTDTGNNRIQRFSPDGRFIVAWGEGGDELGQLDRPMHSVFGPDGYLYVAEYLNDRIQVFTENGEAIRSLGTSGTEPGTFDAPGGVAVASNHAVHVADFYNHRAHRLDASGDPLGVMGSSGRALSGALHYPTDIAMLPDGGVVVADAYNNRVQVFESDGSFRRKWGGPLGLGIPGRWPGWFSVATGVTVGPAGLVYVADFYNNRIQVFSPAGKFLGLFGNADDADEQLERPTDVAVAEDGSIYIVDFGHNRITVFREETGDVPLAVEI